MAKKCANCGDSVFRYEKVRINMGVEQYFCLPPPDSKKSCATKHREKLGPRIWRYEVIAVVS